MDTAPPVAVDTADAGDPTPSVAVDTAGDPSPSIERGVETSPPLSDLDVQGSNSDSGLVDVGEGEAALWGDGCLDDIDMIELADLVSFFLFSTPREKRKRDRETISIPFVFFFHSLQISDVTDALYPTNTGAVDLADRLLEIANVSTPLAVTV